MSLILLDFHRRLSDGSNPVDDDESQRPASLKVGRTWLAVRLSIKRFGFEREGPMICDGAPSAVQKGKVTESLVASTLILASDGRLSPFAPLSDDCGVDLIILDKVTRRTLCLQVKSRIVNPSRQTVQFGLRKSTLSNGAKHYLLGVLFDPRNIALTASWLIPMARIPDLSVDKPDRYSLSPSTDLGSRDRYQAFRLNSASDLAEAILRELDGSDLAA